MSLGSVFNIARTALSASQRAVEVTSNNVANASTEGYTRQRAEFAPERPVRYPSGEFGAGVRILGTTRARDLFLDTVYRRSSAAASEGGVRNASFSRMEGILNEPSENGIGAALDKFYGAWSDLATRPTAGGVQAAVQQAGSALATQLNRVGAQVADLAAENTLRLTTAVEEVNRIASSIAELNRGIVEQEAGGKSANTLRDARDSQLDRIGQLTGADVIEHTDGSVAVLLGGLTLVDGSDARALATTVVNGRVEVTRANLTDTPLTMGGEVGGLRHVINVDIPRLQQDVDSFTRGVVESVNALHRTGVTWSGSPPVSTPAGDFFASDPLLTAETDPLRTARLVRLDSAVAASPSAIATSSATATGPGDGSVALQIAGLRTGLAVFTNVDGSARGSESAGDFLRRIATDLAFASRSSLDRAEIDEAMTTQADSRRQEVSGVSIDEELVRLIRFQQSYAAAARLISTADEMAQTLLDMRR